MNLTATIKVKDHVASNLLQKKRKEKKTAGMFTYKIKIPNTGLTILKTKMGKYNKRALVLFLFFFFIQSIIYKL